MKRGPKPTPSKTLRMRGSWRGEKNKHEPEPELGRPICPAWLSKEAKVVWRAVAPLLDGMGLLAKIDRNALTRYCDVWVRWRKAAEWLNEHGEGYPVKDDNGNVKMFRKWPQVTVYADMCATLLRLEGEFGLTPSARSRISAPEPSKKDVTGAGKYIG